ncbi:MAG: hypothetical protein HY696_04670 [Deltaproteobacteria bacterium]|nr:hypothetical protein [Deltaproteobacteria bacterium]
MSDPINLYQLLSRVTAPLSARLTAAMVATCAPLPTVDQWFGSRLQRHCQDAASITNTPAVDGYKEAIVATAVNGFGKKLQMECTATINAGQAKLQCRLFTEVPRPQIRLMTAGYAGCGGGTLDRPPEDPLVQEVGGFDVAIDGTTGHDTPAQWDVGPDQADDGATDDTPPPLDAAAPDVTGPDGEEPDAGLDVEPDVGPEIIEDVASPIDPGPAPEDTAEPEAFTPDDPGMTPVDGDGAETAEPDGAADAEAPEDAESPDINTEDTNEPDAEPLPPPVPGIALCTNADENEGLGDAAESFFATQCLYMTALLTHPGTALEAPAPLAVETFTVTDQGAIQITFAGDPETPGKNHPTNLVGKTITVYPPVTDESDPTYVFEKDPVILGGIYLWGHYDVPNYDLLPPDVKLALEPTVRLTVDEAAGIIRVTTYQLQGVSLLQETYYWPCFWDSAMSALGTDLKQCVSAEVAP